MNIQKQKMKKTATKDVAVPVPILLATKFLFTTTDVQQNKRVKASLDSKKYFEKN